MELCVPEGDDHLRAVCQDCQAVVYANPKVVVACVVQTPTKKVLLAKRAIEPRAGYWGIPQGYMELGETTRQAICREVREETGAEIAEDQLRFRALYNVPGSVQLVYSLTVPEEDLVIAERTTESEAIGLFPLDSLPDLCFPTVQWALDHCRTSSGEIQQKNKLYDSDSGEWSESEDKDGPL
jgi:ADP-ribose pyrophosphatase YjhB (NUDIX family)